MNFEGRTFEDNDLEIRNAFHCIFRGNRCTVTGDHNKFYGDGCIVTGNHNISYGNGNYCNGENNGNFKYRNPSSSSGFCGTTGNKQPVNVDLTDPEKLTFEDKLRHLKNDENLCKKVESIQKLINQEKIEFEKKMEEKEKRLINHLYKKEFLDKLEKEKNELKQLEEEALEAAKTEEDKKAAEELAQKGKDMHMMFQLLQQMQQQPQTSKTPSSKPKSKKQKKEKAKKESSEEEDDDDS